MIDPTEILAAALRALKRGDLRRYAELLGRLPHGGLIEAAGVLAAESTAAGDLDDAELFLSLAFSGSESYETWRP